VIAILNTAELKRVTVIEWSRAANAASGAHLPIAVSTGALEVLYIYIYIYIYILSIHNFPGK